MFSTHTELLAAGRVLVTVAGELDLATCAALGAELTRVGSIAADEIMVDLRGVTFLDCQAVSTLLAARRHATKGGVDLYIRNAQGIARRVLDVTGAAGQLGLTESGRPTRRAGSDQRLAAG